MYKWQHFSINIGAILSNNKIKIALQELWKNRINENKLKFNIQFKIKYDETEIRSISYLQQNISSKDFDQLLEIFKEFWNVKSDYYHHLLI